jgi:hypothetical protein
MPQKLWIIALLAVALVLVGCSAGSPATGTPESAAADEPSAVEQVAESISGEDYPAPPQGAPTLPYPEADPRETIQETPSALPTLGPLGEPAAGKGHVTGQIMRESSIRPREPLAGWTLFLAQVHLNVSGQISPVASVIEGMAPETVTDRDGRYAFLDIEPGLYALVIKHPLTIVLAHDIETEMDIVVEVVAGEVTVEPLTVVTISD